MNNKTLSIFIAIVVTFVFLGCKGNFNDLDNEDSGKIKVSFVEDNSARSSFWGNYTGVRYELDLYDSSNKFIKSITKPKGIKMDYIPDPYYFSLELDPGTYTFDIKCYGIMSYSKDTLVLESKTTAEITKETPWVKLKFVPVQNSKNGGFSISINVEHDLQCTDFSARYTTLEKYTKGVNDSDWIALKASKNENVYEEPPYGTVKRYFYSANAENIPAGEYYVQFIFKYTQADWSDSYVGQAVKVKNGIISSVSSGGGYDLPINAYYTVTLHWYNGNSNFRCYINEQINLNEYANTYYQQSILSGFSPTCEMDGTTYTFDGWTETETTYPPNECGAESEYVLYSYFDNTEHYCNIYSEVPDIYKAYNNYGYLNSIYGKPLTCDIELYARYKIQD